MPLEGYDYAGVYSFHLFICMLICLFVCSSVTVKFTAKFYVKVSQMGIHVSQQPLIRKHSISYLGDGYHGGSAYIP